MQLDHIDKQILNALFYKGCERLTRIAEKVMKPDQEMMSHTGIRKRIKKLEQSEILKIQGNVNLHHLNYKACIILLEMKSYEEVKKVKYAYSDCPRVFFLAEVTGQFNLIIGIVGQNIEVLHQYINYCGPTNKDGILHSDILFFSKFVIPEFLPLNLFSNQSQESKCGNCCKACEAYLDGRCDGCGHF